MIARSLLTQSEAEEVRIFYSYARRDGAWRKEVDRLLPRFEWDVAVRTWYDGEIEPGTEFDPEIDRNLRAADVILLFVSQAFVESDYCRKVEVPVALRRHADGRARVVPVIMEATNPDWQTLEFGRLQALPRNGVPVNAWGDRERALETVVQELVDVVVRQGLHHHAHMRWELYLEGEVTGFAHDDRLAVTTELRRFTGDDTLRCAGIEAGSIVLMMESTQDALAHVKSAFVDGAFRAIGRWTILAVKQLFGAGIRLASTPASTRRPEHLPEPGLMLLPSRKFVPVLFKGLVANDETPLQFEGIINSGDSGLVGAALEVEYRTLLDYFMTMLAVPEDDVYVNLSPDDSARLLSTSLEGTALGAALLEFDFRLKRFAASLLHPDLETGRDFWRTVMRRASQRGVLDGAPLAAFQRVWVAPGSANLYEGTEEELRRLRGYEPARPQKDTSAERPGVVVATQHLKAMTERQHLGHGREESGDEAASICEEVFQDQLIPIVEHEVNEGENFAGIRQIYNSMLFAFWFKNRYRGHPRVARYLDSGKPTQLGVNILEFQPGVFFPEGPAKRTSAANESAAPPRSTSPAIARIRASRSYEIRENREYFERYLDIFERGVFYVEREEFEGGGRKRPRAYLAGGIDLRRMSR